MSALDDRKKRINRFLNWLYSHKEQTIYDCRAWFFRNYAMSETAIDETLKQLKDYQFITYQGIKIKSKGLKQLL